MPTSIFSLPDDYLGGDTHIALRTMASGVGLAHEIVAQCVRIRSASHPTRYPNVDGGRLSASGDKPLLVKKISGTLVEAGLVRDDGIEE